MTQADYALELHKQFVQVAQVRQSLSEQLRNVATRIAWKKLYTMIRFDDAPRFEHFNDWLEYTAGTTGLSKQTLSSLSGFCEYVVEPVSIYEMSLPNGIVLTPEWFDSLDLYISYRLGSAGRRLVRDGQIDRLPEVLDRASRATTRDAFEQILEEMGLKSKPSKTVSAAHLLTAHGEYILVPVIESEEFNRLLRKLTLQPVAAPDELGDILRHLLERMNHV